MPTDAETRRFSPEKKAEILRRHLAQQGREAELCEEYGLEPGAITQWQEEAFHNLVGAFERASRSERVRVDDGAMRVLFWNVHGSAAAADLAVKAVADLDLDFVAFAETPEGGSWRPTETLRRIQPADQQHRIALWQTSERFQVETIADDGSAWHAVRVAPEGSSTALPLVLFCAHRPSLLNHQDLEDTASVVQTDVEFIESVEHRQGSSRSVVIGDLNLDPFHPSMVSIRGFNALSCSRLAQRPKDRTFRSFRRKAFYNPMWGHFGDAVAPPGTYYWGRSRALGYYWHMLDQVLVRGPLVPHVRTQIITELSGARLLTDKGRIPNRKAYSDHLPLLLEVARSGFAGERRSSTRKNENSHVC